ncbi:hypothetical protein MUB23_00390 [Cuneatibacter sp. NSJ-177]|uniref:hypothetical protein n=1 Tax=Cuneatibacter sp. NSJ-177 TaxID=2931401 RepID=UPI001FD2CE40|nr:hypothetical protein [Cuneatibacter sp. NSJ-177]MCJ7833850.1 hypothetical protein [Cuneatibacter sp. NSJ-177]
MDKLEFEQELMQWQELATKYGGLDILKAMEIDRLDQIASALKGVELYLSLLSDCVEAPYGYGEKFCITER